MTKLTEFTAKADKREFLSELKQQGKLTTTIKSALARHLERQEQRYNYSDHFGIPTLRAGRVHGLSLLLYDQNTYLYKLINAIKKGDAHRRLKNWDNPRALTYVTEPLFTTHDLGRYSSSCMYTHYNYSVDITAYAYLVTRNSLKCKIGRKTKTLHAPSGWAWGHDSNGWRIYKTDVKAVSYLSKWQDEIDYHFTAADVLTKAVRYFIKKANDNFKTRKTNILRELKAKKANEKQQQQKDRLVSRAVKIPNAAVYVCVADSCAAGNCGSGTEVFKRRHKLGNHLRADLLLKISISSDMQKGRIEHAVMQAKTRHITELDKGFSDINYHYSK